MFDLFKRSTTAITTWNPTGDFGFDSDNNGGSFDCTIYNNADEASDAQNEYIEEEYGWCLDVL